MKIQGFSKAMLKWFAREARDLPWRQTRDPYRIWVSEIMLQQTTVATVIPYYRRWFKVFPTIRSLAKAPVEKVLKSWQGLGYYQRARNLKKAAEIVTSEYDGRLPQDPSVVKSLPGFGPYTVGAVLSIAFDRRIPIVDANIRRVVMRLLSKNGNADASQDREILKFLEKVLPQKNTGAFNQSLMELGALVCRSREPLCNTCPVKSFCQAYRKGLQEIIPEVKKRVITDVDVAIALIQKKGAYLIQKRPPTGLFADLWEFPGGKVDPGETPEQAVCREVREELGVEVSFARHLLNLKQFYTQFRAHLYVFACQVRENPRGSPDRLWVPLTRLHKYPMPSGSARILDHLLANDI